MITFSESQQKIIDVLKAVNRAHWINNHNGTISCSLCHTWFHKDDRYSYMRYCPYCNVKMTESEVEKMTNQEKFIQVFGIDVWQQMIVFSGLAEQFKEYWTSPYKAESEGK